MFFLPFAIPAEEKIFAASKAVAGDSRSGCGRVLLLQLVGSALPEGLSLSLRVLNCSVGQQLAKSCPAIPSWSCSSSGGHSSPCLSCCVGSCGGLGSSWNPACSRCRAWTPAEFCDLFRVRGQAGSWARCLMARPGWTLTSRALLGTGISPGAAVH